jgi:hypothetical protein
VHRIILAAEGDDLDLDEDDDLDSTELALLDASADDYQPVPPFTFVGIVPGDGIKTKDDWRYMDAADHSVSALDIYRFCAELEEDDRYDESAAIEADLERQYAEAGLRRVDHIGYHCWETV